MTEERNWTYYCWQVAKVLTVLLAVTAVIAIIREEVLFPYEIESTMIFTEDIPIADRIKQDIENMEVPEHLLAQPKVIVLSWNDVEMLAQLMYAEEEEFINLLPTDPELSERVFKLAGSVILRRAEVNYRGATTIEDVIFTEGQYADRTQGLVRDKQEVPEIIYQWSEDLLIAGPIGPRGLIFQSESPQGDYVYDHIGNQYFCVSERYNE